MENNVYDIQKNYTQVALDLIEQYQGDFSEKNKKELLKLLQQTEQEFIQKIKSLPKETIQDKGNRKLLSMTELKYKLIQDIAIKVIGGIEQTPSLRSMKQLVTYITGGESEYIAQELVENLDEEPKDIPMPDIQGIVEQIGEVILPPDVLERFETSYTGGQQQVKKRPAGFDKIGLVEQFLSDYLGRERTTFQWKTGTLRLNQMRKVSYYHLYLPEINKTLLLNNQYGEGCFLLDGDFDIREAKKSDIKGTEGVLALSFDYSDPKNFLTKLRLYLDVNMIDVYKDQKEKKEVLLDDFSIQNSQKDDEGLRNKIATQDDIKTALAPQKIAWMNLNVEQRPKFKLPVDGQEISYITICRIFGFEGKAKDLYKDDVFDALTVKIFGESLFVYRKNKIKDALAPQKIAWMNLNAEQIQKFKLPVDGQEISYITICRIFGFEGEPKDLYKDDIFDALTVKIFEQEYMDTVLKRAQSIAMIRKQRKIKDALDTQKTIWMNLNSTQRSKFKLTLDGQEMGYVTICRIFGFKGEPKELYKDDVFEQLTMKIFGQEYMDSVVKRAKSMTMIKDQSKIKDVLDTQKAIWMNLSSKQRQKFKLTVDGQEMGYVTICRIFGFKGEQKDLFKDDVFEQLTTKIFGQSYFAYQKVQILSLLQTKKVAWMNLNTRQRVQFKLTIDGKEIGYITICRIFGFEGERDDLIKDDVFEQLTTKIFGESYVEYQKNQIKISLQTQKATWMTLSSTQRVQFKLTIDGKEISYITICRIFGFEGERDDLIKDDVFEQLTMKIFGQEYMDSVVKRAKSMTMIKDQSKIKDVLDTQKAIWINLNSTQRVQFKLTLDGQEMGYIAICRIFGFKREPKDLFKDDVFDALTVKIFGQEYMDTVVKRAQSINIIRKQCKIKNALTPQKAAWMNLNVKQRQKFKLTVDGKEIGYIIICRIFGFEGEQNDLYKDDIFEQLTVKIFGEEI